MDFAWFLYTILIMMVAMAAGVSSLTVWVLTNRRDCLVAAFGFAVYTLETAGVLFDEYMRNKPLMEELFATGLTHPLINIVLNVALVTSVWVWVAMRVYARPQPRHVAIFACLYLVVSIVLAPVGDRASVVRTMAFWASRDLLIIGALVFAWWWRSHKASESDRVGIDRAKGFWIIALALACLVLVEDATIVLLVRPTMQEGWVHDFFWHLTERNLTDNVLMIVCAVRMIAYNREVMGVFAQHPMESVGTGERAVGGHRDFESRLLRFADDHGMSKREREVLGLAIEGKDTQGIANELYISVGTVKAHIHRIYTKAGVESRQDLVNAFWKY